MMCCAGGGGGPVDLPLVAISATPSKPRARESCHIECVRVCVWCRGAVCTHVLSFVLNKTRPLLVKTQVRRVRQHSSLFFFFPFGCFFCCVFFSCFSIQTVVFILCLDRCCWFFVSTLAQAGLCFLL